MEVFESLLACMKTECEEQVRREKADSRLRSTDMLRSIVPRPLSLSFPVTKTVGSIGKLSCPFEGWSCRYLFVVDMVILEGFGQDSLCFHFVTISHLECQACIAQEGPSAARWLPTRHQVFTTLPLPVALTVTGQLGVMKVASTAGCLPAGGREGGQVVPLRGGRPIEVVAKSTARTAVPSAGSSGSHAPYALHKFPHAGPSIYNCIQEFVQAEDLSGISCSACSTAATQSVVEKKLALAARSRDRNEEPRSAGATSEMEQQIMAEIFERCTAMRAVGEKDAFIADFDQGFIEHPLKDNKKEVIVRRKATATAAKPESPASIASTAPDAVATQREADREMLLLSLKQPKVSAAVKRTSLSRLPPLLCLYLCRRTYDGMKGRMKKLAQHVSFPVLLSMDQFHVADGAHRSPLGLAGALAVQGLAVGAGAGTSITALLRSAKNSKSDSGGNYQLRAVVEHKGTADTGNFFLLYPMIQLYGAGSD